MRCNLTPLQIHINTYEPHVQLRLLPDRLTALAIYLVACSLCSVSARKVNGTPCSETAKLVNQKQNFQKNTNVQVRYDAQTTHICMRCSASNHAAPSHAAAEAKGKSKQQ